MNKDEETTLWNTEQTARFLCCSKQHVLRLALLSQIPAIDLACANSRQRMWRFQPQKIEQWLRERENKKTGKL